MSYDSEEVGFNSFMERSIGSVPATTLLDIPNNTGNRLDLDQVQVSGALGNVMQLGGQIRGGDLVGATTRGGELQDLDLTGELRVKDKIIVGNQTFVIDGGKIQLIVKDENGVERILIGRLEGGF
jgi:hypothetical protein